MKQQIQGKLILPKAHLFDTIVYKYDYLTLAGNTWNENNFHLCVTGLNY